MKKRISIGLACVLAVSMILGATTLVSGAAGYDGVEGYAKVWDFESWNVGEVGGNGGNPDVSPLRGNGGFTATITDEWNYLGGEGKSIKFDSDTAAARCISFEHPRSISFKNTAYNAMVFAVKTPKAPADASEKGYGMNIALNDWGTYYNTKNSADTFRIQRKGSSYWEDVAIQDDCLYVPYDFEGLVKVDMADFYKSSAFDPADAAASRLQDNEIQHEVVIEIWVPATGGANGALYMDDIYLRTPDATDVDEYEPEPTPEPEPEPEPENGGREFCDFEKYTAGDSLYDPDDRNGSAIWNGYGNTVTASTEFVGSGSISAEFSNEENRQTWGILALLKTGTGDVADKKYLVMHIASPSADSSKSAAYEDAQGNRRFAFAILPKTETNGAGHWFKTNTTIAGNVKMLADGEATWKQMPGDDFYNYLPFGWSGWVLYDLSGFSEGSLKLDGSTPVNGVEVYTSQCGGRFGKVYLDSVFVIDDEDELSVGISAKGNKNGTDPEEPGNSGDDEPSGPIFIPDLGDSDTDDNTSDPASGSDATDTPSDPVPTGVPFCALPLLFALTAGGAAVGCGRSRSKKA